MPRKMAQKLGVHNLPYLNNQYNLDRVVSLFYEIHGQTGGDTNIRSKSHNVFDDVDNDGVKNRDDIAPNNPALPIPNRAPVASITGSSNSVNLGETVSFSAAGSSDPDGDRLNYVWSVTGPNGFSYNGSSQSISFSTNNAGSYTVKLLVDDGVLSSSPTFKRVSASDESQTFFDDDAIQKFNVPVGSNKCGDVVHLKSHTLGPGVYWEEPRLWATTKSPGISSPQPQYFLIGLDQRPSADRDYSDNACVRFDGTTTRGFDDFDFDMNMQEAGRVTSSGTVTYGKSMNETIQPGTTVHIYMGVADDRPLTIESVTLETNVLYDSDGDGISDENDHFPNNAAEQYDTDGDGIGDNADKFPADPAASVDSDGDGYPDRWNAGMSASDSVTGLLLDAFTADGSEWADSDSDGVGDNSDRFPADIAASVDADSDGYPERWNVGRDASESTQGLFIDKFPTDPAAGKDEDGDGYPG